MKRVKELKNKLILTAVLVVWLLVFWYLRLPCLYRFFLGIDCIGCGMSRAFFSILKLDFVTAFNHHPMFWSVPIVYLYFLFDGKFFGKKVLDCSILVIIAIGFFINWLSKLW